MSLVLTGQVVSAASAYTYNCKSPSALDQNGKSIAVWLSDKNTLQTWSVNYTIRGAEPKDDRTIYIDTQSEESKSSLKVLLSSSIGVSQWVDNSMEEQKDYVLVSPVKGYLSVERTGLKNQFKGEAVLPLINNNQKMQIVCTKNKDTKPDPGCLFCL